VSDPARAQLHVVGCPDCERYRKALDAMTLDLENAEMSLRSERRQKNEARAQVRQIKKQRMEVLNELPNIELIRELWEFWRCQVRPDARNMGARTIEAVRDRLADKVPESDEPAYSPRYIAEAIKGAKHDRWARDHGRDTLVEICQSPENLERFHRSYERYLARRGR
jgi:hypothetical protein